jgi:hypothetical protein
MNTESAQRPAEKREAQTKQPGKREFAKDPLGGPEGGRSDLVLFDARSTGGSREKIKQEQQEVSDIKCNGEEERSGTEWIEDLANYTYKKAGRQQPIN